MMRSPVKDIIKENKKDYQFSRRKYNIKRATAKPTESKGNEQFNLHSFHTPKIALLLIPILFSFLNNLFINLPSSYLVRSLIIGILFFLYP